MDKSITAICRKCSKPAPAAEFRMDLDTKMMVCRGCFGRPAKSIVIEKPKELSKPKDWDKIDEQLAKRAAERDSMTVRVQQIGDSDKALYTCQKCRYKFKYDVYTRRPNRCPYCDANVPRLQFA